MKRYIQTLLAISLAIICISSFASVIRSPFKIQQPFIQKVASNAKIINQSILVSRSKLQKDYQTWQTGKDLHWWSLSWLKKLAKSYDVASPNFKDKKTWNTLLNRVDVIPVSLVVGQAANESDWGRSRFAREGNNYFGQHCMKLGCGLVPKKRSGKEQFEVERFANLLGSIKAYMHMLNVKHAYRNLRTIRAALRAKGKTISGLALVRGLEHYSEHPKYIEIISNIIRYYNLSQYDI